jgi:hypothetical protein
MKSVAVWGAVAFASLSVAVVAFTPRAYQFQPIFSKSSNRVDFKLQHSVSLRKWKEMWMSSSADKSIIVRAKHVEKSPFIANFVELNKKGDLGSATCNAANSNSKLALGVHLTGVIDSVGGSVIKPKPSS